MCGFLGVVVGSVQRPSTDTHARMNAVPCCPCLLQLVMSCLVPGRRVYTPSWPKWPKKVWLQTAQPGNKIGLEMDDGSPRPGKDRFDVDGTDDDSEVGGRAGGCASGWAGG